MENSVGAIGIAWYLKSDYETLRALFIDGEKMPRTFLQWQDQAEELRERYMRKGFMVVKAHIHPAAFPAWCAANGCDLDARGRTKFASAEAHRIAMEMKRQ